MGAALGVAVAVDRRLRELLATEAARWSSLDPRMGRIVDDLRGVVLEGGKRLRPAFCLWGHQGAGGSCEDVRAVDVAAGLELLHTFALLHDDVMDGSDTRRGSPSLQRRLAGEHEANRLAGDPRRFGDGLAVLVGDLAFALADRLLSNAPPAARAVWDELRIELTMGQFLDVWTTAHGEVDVATACRIVRYKAARYTVERPLQLGAALAGAADRLAPHYSAYGVPVGEAFQLRDDLLGVFGTPEVTGKPVGDDLRQGKPTVLLALARARAEGNAAAVLRRAGAADLTPEEIDRMCEVLVDCGARDAVERSIDERLGRGLDALSRAPIPDAARQALRDLALTATDRVR
jgi:geranylgeranyl diphosphate synthase type I